MIILIRAAARKPHLESRTHTDPHVYVRICVRMHTCKSMSKFVTARGMNGALPLNPETQFVFIFFCSCSSRAATHTGGPGSPQALRELPGDPGSPLRSREVLGRSLRSKMLLNCFQKTIKLVKRLGGYPLWGYPTGGRTSWGLCVQPSFAHPVSSVCFQLRTFQEVCVWGPKTTSNPSK